MTASTVRPGRAGPAASPGPGQHAADLSLLTAGAVAAAFVVLGGLAVLTVLVLIAFIAAPHAGFGLPAVLRAAAALWLVGHHVGFTFRGAGRIGLLPVGLVVLPGALLWRAGRWVVRAGQVSRLRHVGYAALALAVPYAVATGLLALVSRSAVESSSVLQSVVCGFLLAFAAGGLGGARALAPWRQLLALLPAQSRAVVAAVTGCLAVLAAAGALIAGVSLAAHLGEAVRLERSLDPGFVGSLALLALQAGYLPNAVVWGVAFALGPGFAFGAATVVAPTGSALTQLPALPLLAALPPGAHAALPGWLEPVVLALPYIAGAVGGLLLVRAVAHLPGPLLALDVAPLAGLVSGVAAGLIVAIAAAFSGGPLGDGRLADVGPSPWQAGLVSALETGIAAAVTAGALNYVALRRAGLHKGGAAPPQAPEPEPDDGHVIYVDPWAGEPPAEPTPPGPSSLPSLG